MTEERIVAADVHLRAIVAARPRDPVALASLRDANVRKLRKLLSYQQGTCMITGARVVVDDGSIYSTGSIFHLDDEGRTLGDCTHRVKFDPPTPRQQRIRAAIDRLS